VRHAAPQQWTQAHRISTDNILFLLRNLRECGGRHRSRSAWSRFSGQARVL